MVYSDMNVIILLEKITFPVSSYPSFKFCTLKKHNGIHYIWNFSSYQINRQADQVPYTRTPNLMCLMGHSMLSDLIGQT